VEALGKSHSDYKCFVYGSGRREEPLGIALSDIALVVALKTDPPYRCVVEVADASKGRFTHTMPFPCCSHAVPLPFTLATASEIGMLLITSWNWVL
jgi:hypothetical protein